jgi:hypothetical protein
MRDWKALVIRLVWPVAIGLQMYLLGTTVGRERAERRWRAIAEEARKTTGDAIDVATKWEAVAKEAQAREIECLALTARAVTAGESLKRALEERSR